MTFYQMLLAMGTIMHLSMLSPTTPRAGNIGGYIGGFCTFVPKKSPRG